MDPISLTFSVMFTHHVNACNTCNEIHPKLELSYSISEQVDIAAGAFYNSKRRVSTYLGIRGTYDPVFAEIGIVGGYERADVLPFGRVGVNFNQKASAFVFPILHGDEVRVGVGLEVKF